MVLMLGQNEVLLLLLSLFEGKKRCFVSRAVTDVGWHVELIKINNMDRLKTGRFLKTH